MTNFLLKFTYLSKFKFVSPSFETSNIDVASNVIEYLKDIISFLESQGYGLEKYYSIKVKIQEKHTKQKLYSVPGLPGDSCFIQKNGAWEKIDYGTASLAVQSGKYDWEYYLAIRTYCQQIYIGPSVYRPRETPSIIIDVIKFVEWDERTTKLPPKTVGGSYLGYV